MLTMTAIGPIALLSPPQIQSPGLRSAGGVSALDDSRAPQNGTACANVHEAVSRIEMMKRRMATFPKEVAARSRRILVAVRVAMREPRRRTLEQRRAREPVLIRVIRKHELAVLEHVDD